MEQISIAFMPDQLDTLILACGIAARNSMPENATRCRELQDNLIHAKVMSQDLESISAKVQELWPSNGG